MKISELWKEKTKEILKLVYSDKMDEIKIDNYLQKLINQHEQEFPNMYMRNLYTRENFNIPFDSILDIIKQEELCIGANGTLTYNFNRIKTPIPDLLIKMKSDRKIYKKKVLEIENKINQTKEQNLPVDINDEILLKYYDNIQTKIKEDMNSVYGIQSLKTSFIYNPDTASMITGQARQLISEMMWSIEKFLSSNIPFNSVDEMLSYVNAIVKESNNESKYDSYISYIPTKDDIKERILELLEFIPNYKIDFDKYSISLFHMLESLTNRQRLYLYYKNNLFKFLELNPKVFNFINILILSNEDFMNPSNIPENFKVPLQTLYNILNEFVISHITTPNRVFKYMNKFRRSIIISDTDSVIINLDPWVKLCNKLASVKFDDFYDEVTTFKVINIAAYLSTEITKIAGKLYCEKCNIPQDLHNFLEMKNEFLFKRIVLYKNTKKNYIAHTRLREGTFVDKVSVTGAKLRGSAINPEVQTEMVDLIDRTILKNKYIDPISILKGISEIENHIYDKIKAGDKTYGRRSRYSGLNGYKTGIYQNAAGRGAYIWNLLVPEEPINIHDYSYMFKTKINTIEDVHLLLKDYPAMQKKIIDKVYKDVNLSKYGLSVICVPIEGNDKLPNWVIDIIDLEDISNKHLQPIISLLPSIGIYNTKISSTKNTFSSIISF